MSVLKKKLFFIRLFQYIFKIASSKNTFSKLLFQKKHFQIYSLKKCISKILFQNCSLKTTPLKYILKIALLKNIYSKYAFSKLLFQKNIYFQKIAVTKIHL